MKLPLPAPFFEMRAGEEQSFFATLQNQGPVCLSQQLLQSSQAEGGRERQDDMSPPGHTTQPAPRETRRGRKRPNATQGEGQTNRHVKLPLPKHACNNDGVAGEERSHHGGTNGQKPERSLQEATPPEITTLLPKRQRTLFECYAASESRNSKVPTCQAMGLGIDDRPCRPSQGHMNKSISSDMPSQVADNLPVRFLTWNVMGLTTVKEELTQLVASTSPDILVLTETKLTERSQRKCWLRYCLNEYSLHFSSSMHQRHTEQIREGSGGVMIAVKKALVPQGCITRLSNQEAHRSHLVQLCLHPPRGNPISVQGVYMPFDMDHRASIYTSLSALCKKSDHNVVLGDFNAALYPIDRSHGQLQHIDHHHALFLGENELQPTDKSNRPYTFTQTSASGGTEVAQSRIDDILVSSSLHAHASAVTQVLQATDDSDHLPLLAALDLGATGFIPLGQGVAPQQPEFVPKFALPMKQDQLLTYQSKLHVTLGTRIHSLKGRIESHIAVMDGLPECQVVASSVPDHNHIHGARLQAAKERGFDAQIQKFALEISEMLQTALDVAKQICDQTEPKPRKRFLCRGDTRKLMDMIAQGKQARAEYEACQDGDGTRQELHETLRQLSRLGFRV